MTWESWEPLAGIYGKAADPDSFVPKKYCALLLMVQKSQTTTWNV